MTRPVPPLPAALTSPEDLIGAGLAPARDRATLDQLDRTFRIRVSPAMAANPTPAILRQFVPSAPELVERPEELADPIGDAVHSPVPGLTHRYPDRVILHTTQTCEVYCRFCFRRETVGEAGMLAESEVDGIVTYLSANPQIWEVILTGGDPLVLSPRRLRALLTRLASVPSVQVIRFHSRVPVVAPERISPDLATLLEEISQSRPLHAAPEASGMEAAPDLVGSNPQVAGGTARVEGPAIWIVVHTNHPDEITDAARAAFARLARAGVPLLSQTVLLRGVNDDPDILEALFRALIRSRVKPYYLHHPDLARGTGHFRLPLAEGQRIMAALRGRISGTALPLYVLDIPGGHGKVPVGPGYLEPVCDGEWIVTDPQGIRHTYRDL